MKKSHGGAPSAVDTANQAGTMRRLSQVLSSMAPAAGAGGAVTDAAARPSLSQVRIPRRSSGAIDDIESAAQRV